MRARLRSWWQKITTHPVATVLFVLSALLVVLILGGYKFSWGWTGFNGSDKAGKTLWDWMQLLIIPFALAIIAIFFNRSERKNEQRVASDNQQEAALQEYIKEMSLLLLEKNLRKSDVDAEARKIARVRTLTILHRFNEERKTNILQFLYESGLIDRSGSIVMLHGASLNRARLSGVYLNEADMRGANLIEADLSGAFLNGANLAGANLTGVDLHIPWLTRAEFSRLSSTTFSKLNRDGKFFMGGYMAGYSRGTGEHNLLGINLSQAILNEADLRSTNLAQVDLHGSQLLKAKLQDANLSNTNLSGAVLIEANLENANLSRANLESAALVGANLHRAKLIEANLREAQLHGANLRLTDLTKADLSGASLDYVDLRKTIVTDEQLAKAQSLKSAIMPDGSIHP